jgi:hypothetical protein
MIKVILNVPDNVALHCVKLFLSINIMRLQRFGSGILHPSSGKKKEGRKKCLSVGPLVELDSELDHSVQQICFLSPFLYLMTEVEFNFRDVAIL